jgi:hypothetical protein
MNTGISIVPPGSNGFAPAEGFVSVQAYKARRQP